MPNARPVRKAFSTSFASASEAIQKVKKEIWIASSQVLLAMTATKVTTTSRSRGAMRPEFCIRCPFSKQRGRREDRVRAAPAVSCARCTSKNAHEHTGSAEAFRPSPRNGFTAYNVLSPVTGLSCHRRSREALASWKLDTSVGVSGPHDFAVRIGALVSRAAASTASHTQRS
jgi:hypothetical protein